MNDFRTQISEDIKEYQLRYPNISNIKKDEWAFNYWVLDKFFMKMKNLLRIKSLITMIWVLMLMKYMKTQRSYT